MKHDDYMDALCQEMQTRLQLAYDKEIQRRARHLRIAVWMAIAGAATGIPLVAWIAGWL